MRRDRVRAGGGLAEADSPCPERLTPSAASMRGRVAPGLSCGHTKTFAIREWRTNSQRQTHAKRKVQPASFPASQDLLLLLRLSLVLPADDTPSYAARAAELSLTASEVHGAVGRALVSLLALKDERGRPRARLDSLRLFVQHGARYCFPAKRGPQTRGVPTGYAAPPLKEFNRSPAGEPPPVWPDKDGSLRGDTLYPLYPTAPHAAVRHPSLYELPALFDAIRAGSARERALDVPLLDERWSSDAPDNSSAP